MMDTKPQSIISDLRSHARRLDREIADLERRYGTGIRPAWVGDEIGVLRHQATFARAQADEKEAALEAQTREIK